MGLEAQASTSGSWCPLCSLLSHPRKPLLQGRGSMGLSGPLCPSLSRAGVSEQGAASRRWPCGLGPLTHPVSPLQAYAMMLSLSEDTPLHATAQSSLGAWLNITGAPSESGAFNPSNHL